MPDLAAEVWRVARILRAQTPTHDGLEEGLTTPANDLPRAARYELVTCTRASPFELRGSFFALHVLRVGAIDEPGAAAAEISLGGREFRDAIPVVAGSAVRLPRGCRAAWIRPALSDAGDPPVRVELLLVQAPAVDLAPQQAVIPSERAALVASAMVAGGSLITSISVPQRCAYRIRAVGAMSYNGTAMVMPPYIRAWIVAESGGAALATAYLRALASGTAGVLPYELDTVVPIYPIAGVGGTYPTAVQLRWDGTPNHVAVDPIVYLQPHPLAAGVGTLY